MLHITVTSSWDHSQVALKFSEYQTSSISEKASVSQVWRMHYPRLLAFDMPSTGPRDPVGWSSDNDLPLLSLAEESRTGKTYCRAHIGLVLARNAEYYVYNILTMQGLIAIANMSTFAIHGDDISGRLGVLLTLILASAAFKIVTTDKLPETPYITIIDEFTYFVLGQQARSSPRASHTHAVHRAAKHALSLFSMR